jgi:hypothetical protein
LLLHIAVFAVLFHSELKIAGGDGVVGRRFFGDEK